MLLSNDPLGLYLTLMYVTDTLFACLIHSQIIRHSLIEYNMFVCDCQCSEGKSVDGVISNGEQEL